MKYYLLTLALHNQKDPISELVENYERSLSESGGRMKRENTKQILARSLESLLDEGVPFERITVAAIVAECDASKTTFYNHFHDKYDLMVWYLEDASNPPLVPRSTACPATSREDSPEFPRNKKSLTAN